VPGSFKYLKSNIAKFDAVTVLDMSNRVLRFTTSTKINRCPHPFPQFDMARKKVRMEMSQEHMTDGTTPREPHLEDTVLCPAVDQQPRSAGFFVGDQIRHVRKTGRDSTAGHAFSFSFGTTLYTECISINGAKYLTGRHFLAKPKGMTVKLQTVNPFLYKGSTRIRRKGATVLNPIPTLPCRPLQGDRCAPTDMRPPAADDWLRTAVPRLGDRNSACLETPDEATSRVVFNFIVEIGLDRLVGPSKGVHQSYARFHDGHEQ
jgi:hypothetical protein